MICFWLLVVKINNEFLPPDKWVEKDTIKINLGVRDDELFRCINWKNSVRVRVLSYGFRMWKVVWVFVLEIVFCVKIYYNNNLFTYLNLVYFSCSDLRMLMIQLFSSPLVFVQQSFPFQENSVTEQNIRTYM